MAIYANLSDKMALPSSTGEPLDFDGSIFFAFGNPSHQTLKRKKKKSFEKYAHLENRIFDPQLYLADLSADDCSNVCTKLSSYSWFNVNVRKYNSKEMKQSEWKPSVIDEVKIKWEGSPTTDSKKIVQYTKDCLFYQREIGCNILVAPAPTTYSVALDYSQEIEWLNAARQVKRDRGFTEPLYATVALSTPLFSQDKVVVWNRLSSIANAVSAREFDGVYLVFCQTGDSGISKHTTNENALYNILRFIKLLKESDPAPSIIVNGMGFFGLACRAVGADAFGAGWYRKQYRIHLADFEDTQLVLNKAGDLVSPHKSVPKYWTCRMMGDIGLPKNFDKLVKDGFLDRIRDETIACVDLLAVADKGKSVKGQVDAWIYRPSNVTAAREHYLHSCIQTEKLLDAMNPQERLDYMKDWFNKAVELYTEITEALRSGSTSHVDHIVAWQKAFERFLLSQ